MAPELLARRGRSNITPKVDIWALGCIMHELAMQTVTFPGSSKELKKIEENIR
jgi:serine/threonine protein kinase